MNLRPYQQKAKEDIRSAFSQGKKHVILQAPTGSGKTVIFSSIAKDIASKNNKVLILTNRAELLLQAGGSIKKVGLNSFYIQAGSRYVSNSFNSYIAMSQTLRRRVKEKYWIEFLKTIDLFIIDEAHIQEFNWLFELDFIKNKYVIGFTATPRRNGKMRQLGLDYEHLITSVTVKELIDMNFLVNDDYYGCDAPDMTGVEIDRMKGDYKENQMFKKFNSPQLYAGVVDNWIRLTPDTKTLIFCVNIQHCIETCLEFQKNGIDARFIVSDVSQPKLKNNPTDGEKVAFDERMKVYELYKQFRNIYSGEREKIFEDFATGQFPILINAGIATTGYDCPDIETIILNRATTSTTLLLQMIGRGSRIADNKTHFNILDFGGNCSRLGYYTESRIWGLWHDEFNGEGLPPVKTCGIDSKGKPISNQKGCNRMILAAYKICPFCGFLYPDKVIESIDLESIYFDIQKKKAVKTKRIKDMTNTDIHDYYKAKGHKPAWLWRQLWYKDGEKAIENFGNEFNWNKTTIQKAKDFCKNLERR